MKYYVCNNTECVFSQSPCYVRRHKNKNQEFYNHPDNAWDSNLSCSELKCKRISEENLMLELL